MPPPIFSGICQDTGAGANPSSVARSAWPPCRSLLPPITSLYSGSSLPAPARPSPARGWSARPRPPRARGRRRVPARLAGMNPPDLPPLPVRGLRRAAGGRPRRRLPHDATPDRLYRGECLRGPRDLAGRRGLAAGGSPRDRPTPERRRPALSGGLTGVFSLTYPASCPGRCWRRWPSARREGRYGQQASSPVKAAPGAGVAPRPPA